MPKIPAYSVKLPGIHIMVPAADLWYTDDKHDVLYTAYSIAVEMVEYRSEIENTMHNQ